MLSQLAPAIGGAVFGIACYLYALHIRRQLDRARALDKVQPPVTPR